MGYAFAHKTIGKRISEFRDEMRGDKADCNRRIADLMTARPDQMHGNKLPSCGWPAISELLG
jgi:hypothetical protein